MIPKCPEQNNVTLRDLTGHYSGDGKINAGWFRIA